MRSRTLVLALATVAAIVMALVIVWGGLDPRGSGSVEPTGAGRSLHQAEVTVPEAKTIQPERTGVAGARAIEAPVPSPAPADLRQLWIPGRAISADGSPVAGARVIAAAVPGWFQGTVDARSVPVKANLPAKRETTTDADGGFRVEGAPAQKVLVALRSSAHAPVDLEVEAHEAKYPVDLGDILMEPGMIVAGRVVDGGMEGLVAVALFRIASLPDRFGRALFDTSTDVLVATSDATGAFATPPLASGPFNLRVEAPGRPPLMYAVQDSTPGFHGGHLIVVGSVLGISGRVVGADEVELQSLSVIAQVDSGASGIPPGQPVPAPVSTRCEPNGDFAIASLPDDAPYTFQMRVRNFATGYDELLVDPVLVSGGASGVELRLRPPTLVRFGLRELGSGKPLDGAEVHLQFWWGASCLSDKDVSRQLRPADAPGWYRMRLPRFEYADWTLALLVSAAGHDAFYLKGPEIHEGEENDLGWIDLASRTPVRVRVVDGQSGVPVEGAVVAMVDEPLLLEQTSGVHEFARETARGSMRVSSRRQILRTGASGIVEFAVSSEDRAWTVADHSDYAPSRVITFQPGGGAQDVLLELQRGSVAVVTVLVGGVPKRGVVVAHDYESPENAQLVLSPKIGFWEQASTDESGRVRFMHLGRGKHFFWIGDERQELVVDEDDTYALTLEAPG